jgi:hypothetical protein
MKAFCYPSSWTNTTGDAPNTTGNADSGIVELTELIKAIRNRCDIYDLVQKADAAHLLPTLLEDLFADAQTIIDEYCTERNDD